MKYGWLFVVIIGITGIYLGIERDQPDYTGDFGEYPCFLCASVEPDYEVVVFSSTFCNQCERAIERIQKLCQLTGIQYGGAYYDDAEESFQKLSELGLEKNTDFLVVILKDGAIVDKDTEADTVVQFLSDTVKEASEL